MGTTITLVVLLAIAVGTFLVLRRRGVRYLPPWLAAVPLANFLFSLVGSCVAVVQPKDVGVLTSLGRVSNRTLDSGPHLKALWQKVTSIDETVQTDNYQGDGAIPVRIGDGSRSYLSITHRWQIVPERANETFGLYRSNDPTESLRDSVVESQLVSVAQDVLSKYNPIANLQVIDAQEAGGQVNFAPDYDQVAEDIASEMDVRYGTDPLVKTVAITVSGLTLSKTTQDKIDAFIAEVANTRIAVQTQQTAEAEKIANEKLAASVTSAPNVLVSKCLDLMIEAAKTGYQLPAGWSCWQGGGSAVVVPSR